MGWIEIYVTNVPNDKLRKLSEEMVEGIENILFHQGDWADKSEVDMNYYEEDLDEGEDEEE